MGGHDASKINCLELLEQHVKNDETVGSKVSVQVDPKKKGPKSRKDVELPVEGNQDNDNIPDLPEVDGETVRQILNTAENRLFYGISIGPAAFLSFRSSIFKPLIRKTKIITYLDDVFIQDNTTDTMLKTLDQYHNILKNENLRAAPDKSFFFLDSVKFLGHQLQNNHRHPFKPKIDEFLKLQPPKN